MKRLIAITTLGLALGFSSFSSATDFMNLYTKPMAKSEVGNEIKGGDVEKDYMSFYISLKGTTTTTSPKMKEQETDEKSISVFGVQITQRVEM